MTDNGQIYPSREFLIDELKEQQKLIDEALAGWDRSMKRETTIFWFIFVALILGFLLGLDVASNSINAILK